MKILLDTATFWWIASGSPRLPKEVVDVFADPSNDVALSPVSIWELLVKHQIGKLPTPVPLVDLLAQARQGRLIRSLPVTETAVMRLPALPQHIEIPLIGCLSVKRSMKR